MQSSRLKDSIEQSNFPVGTSRTEGSTQLRQGMQCKCNVFFSLILDQLWGRVWYVCTLVTPTEDPYHYSPQQVEALKKTPYFNSHKYIFSKVHHFSYSNSYIICSTFGCKFDIHKIASTAQTWHISSLLIFTNCFDLDWE